MSEWEHSDKGFVWCGTDVFISNQAIIKRPQYARIGNHVAIDPFCYFTTDIQIGDYCHFAAGNLVIGGADAYFSCGHFAEFAPGCRIVCAGDEWLGEGLVSPLIPKEYRDRVINEPVRIENFAGLGTGAIVLSGVTLHDGAVLAANSLAKHDIPAWEIWGGTPARFLKKRRSDKMKQYAKEMGYDL